MIKSKTSLILLFAIIAVAFVIVFGIINRVRKSPAITRPAETGEWVHAHNLLLNIDYEFRPDTFVVVEGADLDYKLSLVSPDWGIFVSSLKGFAKAFIFTDRPNAEFYRLIGDSDLYKWEQAHKLTASEPAYSLYQKDGKDHLRQDYTFDVKKDTRLPDYFPVELVSGVKEGRITKIAGGAYYYISPDDVYIVHFIAPFPVADGIYSIIDETVARMQFGIGGSTPREPSQNPAPRDEPAPENETTAPPLPPSSGSGSGGGGGDVPSLPPNL